MPRGVRGGEIPLLDLRVRDMSWLKRGHPMARFGGVAEVRYAPPGIFLVSTQFRRPLGACIHGMSVSGGEEQSSAVLTRTIELAFHPLFMRIFG